MYKIIRSTIDFLCISGPSKVELYLFTLLEVFYWYYLLRSILFFVVVVDVHKNSLQPQTSM